MNPLRYIISRLTMVSSGECLFLDPKNGEEVFVFVDCYYVQYLAHSKFGFRMERPSS